MKGHRFAIAKMASSACEYGGIVSMRELASSTCAQDPVGMLLPMGIPRPTRP